MFFLLGTNEILILAKLRSCLIGDPLLTFVLPRLQVGQASYYGTQLYSCPARIWIGKASVDTCWSMLPTSR